MVDSRLRVNPPSLFHCFAYVIAPGKITGNRVKKTIPEEFEEKEIILKSIPDFCFPCTINHDGVQYSTFVLTDLDSKFRFGFCRYPPFANHCLCIVSYFPWFHTFYAVLDKVAQINAKDNTFKGITKFLEALNSQAIPAPGSKLFFSFDDGDTSQSFKVTIPDTTKLPCIPDNRNLTEYFAKVTPENMVNLFISMLFERRIIITSDKLSVLTAVVHGSVSLLYPMQWQHIYIPILPAHLIDYCCAPMPFLLGVHASMMEKVRSMPLSEVVLLDADTNEIQMINEDLVTFPSRMSTRLKKKLKHIDRALQDYVSRQFLNCLADLIGGYREALKFLETDQGEKIVFDDQLFLNSRTGTTKVFLEQILNLQSFRQFIAGRLEMLNDDQSLEDLFENAINQRSDELGSETKYSQLKDKMKKGGGALKKGGAAFKKTVDGSYSQLKGMAQDIDTKEFKKKIKDKVKDGYKGVKQITLKDSSGDEKKNSPKLRRQSGPNRMSNKKSYLVNQHVPHPKRPPPRPPRPSSDLFRPQNVDGTPTPCSTAEMPRKTYSDKEKTSSHSESDIHSLIGSGCHGRHSLMADDSSDSLDVDSRAYSDTDSSVERLNEGYQNPAFVDKNSDLLFSLSGDEEDVTLEHSSLLPPQPYEKHKGRTPSPVKTNEEYSTDDSYDINSVTAKPLEQPVTMKKFDTTCGPFYTPSCDLLNRELEQAELRKHPPSLIRKKPVTGRKPVVPPRPRTSDGSSSNPTSPTSPHRPVIPSRPASLKVNKPETSDLIFASDSSDTSLLNKSLLADLNFEEYHSTPHHTTPNTSPLPSADLLGLEQSLFHETMNSLSPDARSLMGDSSSSSSNSNETQGDSFPTFQTSKAFFERRDNYPNYNINNFSVAAPHVIDRGKVVNSTCNDLFANCYEEAKNMKFTPR